MEHVRIMDIKSQKRWSPINEWKVKKYSEVIFETFDNREWIEARFMIK